MATASSRVDSWPAFLILTLLQDESLASACLIRLGITRQWLIDGQLGAEVAKTAALEDEIDETSYPGDDCHSKPLPTHAIDDPSDFTRVLDRAAEIARRGLTDSGVSSANLLLAIVETNEAIRVKLEAAGATIQRIRLELYPESMSPEPPLRVDDSLVFTFDRPAASVPAPGPSSITAPAASFVASAGHADVWRVLDANLNRAREGLRVLEDFARFLANDSATSSELKSLRHELVSAERLLLATQSSNDSSNRTLRHRDTNGDVGTSQSTSGERSRSSLDDVIVANFRRVQESLRSLEEFGKLLSTDFSSTVKQLRYRTYTLEKSFAFMKTAPESYSSDAAKVNSDYSRRMATLDQALLYVLITESLCRRPWKKVVEESLGAGANVIQLREKSLNDRELLNRAKWIRDVCWSAGSLFIVNDRADVAVAAEADGVHVGQEELTVAEARQILKPGQLIGVSTHNVAQALTAVQDGADYLGVGPVFPSRTKTFDSFPGLSFVQQVAEAVSVPWFAIGGISQSNLASLTAAGATRIAVTSTIASAEHPGIVASSLYKELARVESSHP